MTDYTNKKISIVGAERSGIGAAKLCKKIGAIPFVSDSGDEQKLSKRLGELNTFGIEYESGSHSERIYDCDLMVLSPGVPSSSKVVKNALDKNIEVISELEFASYFCKAKIIGITGTNGKTTTTKLCEHTFSTAGIKCFAAGNVGLAFSEVVLEATENDVIALEISSFQLDHIKKFRPDVAIILNITPDHLDRYENNFMKYASAKMRITENQTHDDYFVYNSDDNIINTMISGVKAVKVRFGLNENLHEGCYILNNKFHFEENKKDQEIISVKQFALKGKHNYLNAMSVIAAAKLLNLKNTDIKKAMQTFSGVEHRLEFVRELNGISFINDSKATNVDSVWYALQSFKNPLRLILGGIDKGNDYERIAELVIKNVAKIYAIGSSAEKIEKFFKDKVEVECFTDMNICVNKAYQDSKKKEVILLSPACASFDMFNNYEHRGEVFKEIVMSIN
ncbi:MAG: UDP-N-acetylmuramoyl-L-alanine--D-glutamate ligase [Melioribacteraceae bacterium]|nr:UDP-N-acetylmuramoyl-L-alanine--D-glutamate ligase [Melioribacteraceae bacterium]